MQFDVGEGIIFRSLLWIMMGKGKAKNFTMYTDDEHCTMYIVQCYVCYSFYEFPFGFPLGHPISVARFNILRTLAVWLPFAFPIFLLLLIIIIVIKFNFSPSISAARSAWNSCYQNTFKRCNEPNSLIFLNTLYKNKKKKKKKTLSLCLCVCAQPSCHVHKNF